MMFYILTLALVASFSAHTVLLLVALLCFLLGAIEWPPQQRINLVALGLFFWLLSILVS